jgi:predicted DNA-binding transcriptional regulator AlpA
VSGHRDHPVLPSLDLLAIDPTRAQALSPDVARVLWTRCVLVQAALLPGLTAPNGEGTPTVPEADQLLDTGEAARRLAVSRDWLYRNASKLPFTVRLGRGLRFSAQGLARYIRNRSGR